MADIHDRPPAGAGAGAVPHPPKGAKMSLHSPKERRTPSSGMGACETVGKGKSSSDAANGSGAAGSDAGVNSVFDSTHEGISLSMGRRTVFPPVPSRSPASSTATSSNPSSGIRGKVPSLHFSPHRNASNGGSKSNARWGDTPRGDWSEASDSLSSGGAFLTGTRFEEDEEEEKEKEKEEGEWEEGAGRLPDITTATPRGGDDSSVKNVLRGGALTSAQRGEGEQQQGGIDDEGVSESGDLVGPLRRMEPNRDVTRRYFFGNTHEKPLAFLRYFDVHIPKTERFEKIVGGKVESEQNDLMRYYYSEFLAAPPFESSLPLDKRRMDVEDLQEFVDTVNPKTRVDAFPLYVLLKDLVKRIVTKQMELFSREISQSRDRIAGLQEQAAHAANRVESTQREYALRLQKESARLADREMELVQEQKRTRKMKSVAEELGIKVDSQGDEIDRLKERLEEVEGMLESEALKRLSAMREAEALEEKTRTLQSQVKSVTSSTRQLKENLGMIDESGNEVSDYDAAAWAASRSWRNGSKGRRTSVSFHAAMEEVGGFDDVSSDSFNGSVSFKGSEGGGLNVESVLQRMGMTERGKALNLLLAQPAVAGLMDDEAVADDLDDYMSDKLLRSLIKARIKRERGDEAQDYDGASLMASVLKTSMDDEVQNVMRGTVASSGAGWSSKLVAESIGSDLESAATLLTAAFDRVKDLAGESASVDAVCKAMRCSNKAEMTRWVLQGDGEVLKEIMAEYPAVVVQAQRTFMAERRGSKSLGRRGSKMGEDLLGASQRNNSTSGEGEEGWGQRFRRGSFASSMHGGEEGKAPAYMPGEEGGANAVFSLERKHGRVTVQHRETQSEAGHDKGVGTEDAEAEADEKKTARGIAAARLLLKKPKESGGEATSIIKVVNMAKKVRAQMTTQQALKTIAQIFLGKLELDKQSDMHRRPRQSLPDYVRDFFTQQFGLPSVARSKLADLMEKLKKDVEGKKCHPRIRLFHNLIGLDATESYPSQDQCTFVLSLVQELFPSWRYGQTFVRDFSQPEIKLPMAAVEFAVEKALTQPKHGGFVPESLRKDIMSKGYRSVMKGKGAGIKAPAGEEIVMIDADEVLEICNYHFLELEIKSITALMNLFASCDTNGDGVLQYDEFAALIARIDQYVTQQDVMEMYNECVGDDDVIDKEELLGLISTRGLKFALFQSK